MSALVTLAQAKLMCRIVATDEDDLLNLMIAQASAAVVERVDDTTLTDTWTDPTTTPAAAQGAVLEMVLSLHERDTTIQAPSVEDRGKLPPRVERLITRMHKPAIA